MTNGFFKLFDKVIFPASGNSGTGDIDPMLFAASLEEKSSHPLAAAIVSDYVGCIATSTRKTLKVQKVKIVKGVGVEGWIAAEADELEWLHCAVGNEKLLKEMGGQCIMREDVKEVYYNFLSKYADSGVSILVVVIEDELRAIIALADTMRTKAPCMVAAFNYLGIDVTMLTGDSKETAHHIARKVGIHPANVKFRLLPQEKLDWVKSSVDDRNRLKVLMLGDGNSEQNLLVRFCCNHFQFESLGINDATALAAAHVGVAVGAGCSAMAR